MNQNVIDYLQENKEKYAQDVLVGQLRIGGYSELDISDGVAAVYGNSDQVVVPAPAVPIKYAGFWIRYVASVIDALVLIIPNMIISVVFDALSVPSLGTVFTYIILWTKKYQATLGKQAVGVRVISDKSESLSWGQLILRETIGKFISAIILLVGYIMAGFTERKQALHDKIASTAVVYDDPNKKTPVWIFIVSIILPSIAMIGILASIVLVSLNSAKDKASDAAAKSIISSVIPDALIYLDEKGSLLGYNPASQFTVLRPCNGQPIINISKDGKNLAIFVNSCADSKKYFCDDLDSNMADVDQAYATSGKTDCGMKK